MSAHRVISPSELLKCNIVKFDLVCIRLWLSLVICKRNINRIYEHYIYFWNKSNVWKGGCLQVATCVGIVCVVLLKWGNNDICVSVNTPASVPVAQPLRRRGCVGVREMRVSSLVFVLIILSIMLVKSLGLIFILFETKYLVNKSLLEEEIVDGHWNNTKTDASTYVHPHVGIICMPILTSPSRA